MVRFFIYTCCIALLSVISSCQDTGREGFQSVLKQEWKFVGYGDDLQDDIFPVQEEVYKKSYSLRLLDENILSGCGETHLLSGNYRILSNSFVCDNLVCEIPDSVSGEESVFFNCLEKADYYILYKNCLYLYYTDTSFLLFEPVEEN